jgi:hypothetical protein
MGRTLQGPCTITAFLSTYDMHVDILKWEGRDDLCDNEQLRCFYRLILADNASGTLTLARTVY